MYRELTATKLAWEGRSLKLKSMTFQVIRFVLLAISFSLISPGICLADSGSPKTQPPTESVSLNDIRLSFYAYDREAPLSAKLEKRDEKPNGTRFNLSYDSVHDQRVTAILSIPKQASGHRDIV